MNGNRSVFYPGFRGIGIGRSNLLAWALLFVAVIVSLGGCSSPEPAMTSLPSSPLALQSPLSPAPLESSAEIHPLPPATTTALAAVSLPEGGFELTVLHTNDTWGYLLPCG
jgi:hypothetical protein